MLRESYCKAGLVSTPLLVGNTGLVIGQSECPARAPPEKYPEPGIVQPNRAREL